MDSSDINIYLGIFDGDLFYISKDGQVISLYLEIIYIFMLVFDYLSINTWLRNFFWVSPESVWELIKIMNQWGRFDDYDREIELKLVF